MDTSRRESEIWKIKESELLWGYALEKGEAEIFQYQSE